MADSVKPDSGYRKVSAKKAQQLANEGKLVIIAGGANIVLRCLRLRHGDNGSVMGIFDQDTSTLRSVIQSLHLRQLELADACGGDGDFRL